MAFSIIAAIAKNNVIGYQGKVPWHIPEELQLFKNITTHHKIIMGSNTHRSIGSLLPNRKNIVLSHSNKTISLQTILTKHYYSDEEVFIIGGSQIYRLFLPYTTQLYLSYIKLEPKGDTFFPPYDAAQFYLAQQQQYKTKQGNFIFQKLSRSSISTY